MNLELATFADEIDRPHDMVALLIHYREEARGRPNRVVRQVSLHVGR